MINYVMLVSRQGECGWRGGGERIAGSDDARVGKPIFISLSFSS